LKEASRLPHFGAWRVLFSYGGAELSQNGTVAPETTDEGSSYVPGLCRFPRPSGFIRLKLEEHLNFICPDKQRTSLKCLLCYRQNKGRFQFSSNTATIPSPSPLTVDLFHRMLHGYSVLHSRRSTTYYVPLGPSPLVPACSPHAVGLLTSRIHQSFDTQHIPQLTPPCANVAPQPRLPRTLRRKSIGEWCRQIYRREARARSTISAIGALCNVEGAAVGHLVASSGVRSCGKSYSHTRASRSTQYEVSCL
jgi:hypothetical protein